MFESLDDQMKHNNHTPSVKTTLLKWAVAGLVSILLVAGLYFIALP